MQICMTPTEAASVGGGWQLLWEVEKEYGNNHTNHHHHNNNKAASERATLPHPGVPFIFLPLCAPGPAKRWEMGCQSF